MGDIADGLIDGTFDSITGEYLGEGPGYPRTAEKDCGVHFYEKPTIIEDANGTIRLLDYDKKNFSKGTKAIRKELAIFIKKKIKENVDGKGEHYYIQQARQEINIKYGKGWRKQF